MEMSWWNDCSRNREPCTIQLQKLKLHAQIAFRKRHLLSSQCVCCYLTKVGYCSLDTAPVNDHTRIQEWTCSQWVCVYLCKTIFFKNIIILQKFYVQHIWQTKQSCSVFCTQQFHKEIFYCAHHIFPPYPACYGHINEHYKICFRFRNIFTL